MDCRVAAAKVIASTLRGRASLATLIPGFQTRVKPRDRALLQELCFGTLRYYPRLEAILGLLLARPFNAKDIEVQALLACALYQLTETRIPAHAAIGESVQAAAGLKKVWAKGLVNGVLRRFQREQADIFAELAGNSAFQFSHPGWLREQLIRAWPQQAQDIFAANNARPPMTLRVNRLKSDRESYAELLENSGIGFERSSISPSALILNKPLDTVELPHFDRGWVSVQDEAAQLSAGLLNLQPGQRVLDACCAPGGKSCHMLEQQPNLELVALDIEAGRLQRVRQNLDRLQLNAQLVAADAGDPGSWWDGKPFDRILLDAPCSATGVIRRHPDIKVLRRQRDIAKLATVQGQLLRELWPLLKPGGRLVYATCSVLPQENNDTVTVFAETQPDAQVLPLEADWGVATATGRQLFPRLGGHDGFYYAVLRKGA